MSKSFTSPIGIAGFSSITKPDTKFDADGVYQVRLNVAEEKAEALIEQMKEEAMDELGPKKATKAKFPVKPGDDGTVEIKFKSKNKPKLFDSKGNPITDTEELRIGSGSKLRVKGSMKAYENGANIGVAVYLNEVQIIKLVDFGGFQAVDDEDDDAYVAAVSSPKKPKQDAGGAEVEAEEEELADVDF